MAWSDPPIHKPGNKKCPKCGSGQGLYLFLNMRNPWSTWECCECGYRLGIDARRFWPGCVLAFPTLFAVFPLFVLLFPLLSIWAIPIAFLAVGAAVGIIHWWFLSIEVKGKGLNRELNPKG